jgi:hypothetical protein
MCSLPLFLGGYVIAAASLRTLIKIYFADSTKVVPETQMLSANSTKNLQISQPGTGKSGSSNALTLRQLALLGRSKTASGSRIRRNSVDFAASRARIAPAGIIHHLVRWAEEADALVGLRSQVANSGMQQGDSNQKAGLRAPPGICATLSPPYMNNPHRQDGSGDRG